MLQETKENACIGKRNDRIKTVDYYKIYAISNTFA